MAKHIFVGNSVVLQLFEGPELRTHYWEDREEKKSPAPGWIPTRNHSVTRRVLYHCATTAAPRVKRLVRDLVSTQQCSVAKRSESFDFAKVFVYLRTYRIWGLRRDFFPTTVQNISNQSNTKPNNSIQNHVPKIVSHYALCHFRTPFVRPNIATPFRVGLAMQQKYDSKLTRQVLVSHLC